MPNLVIMTAGELKALDSLERQAARRATREQPQSSCHHCGAPLTFSATPHGVGPDAAEVMLWFGRRGDGGCKAFDPL
jgi:hypothetical protein